MVSSKQFLTILSSVTVILIVILAPSNLLCQKNDGCTTSDCHADMGKKEYIHGPVGAGICTICHVPVKGKDHEFKFFAEKDQICFACHDESRKMTLENHVHTPVLNGDCVKCHDPHQSDNHFTLRAQGAELCYQCHDRKLFTEGQVHGPVGSGDCNACHNPHASANEKQLLVSSQQLCFQCHIEKIDELEKRHVHPPVGENCLNCHSPHTSMTKNMLLSEVPALCFECHTEQDSVIVSHEPYADGSCHKCHDSHASDYPKLFTVAASDLCTSCHEEMGEYISSHEFKHGPVQEGDCNACHNPHGSDNYRILNKYFPSEFYVSYKTENYASCFECHNQDVALEENTTTLTNFRDNDKNLHYLHVNKEVKGRSCKACHQAHATDQAKHIRKSVPYGSMNWELPVEFTKFDDGGNCVVGCHSPKDYKR